MSRLLSEFTFIGFLVLVVFGFPMIKHGMMGESPCFASNFAGYPCSTTENAMAVHHLTAYQNFFHALNQPMFVSFVLVLALFLFPFSKTFLKHIAVRAASFFHSLRLRQRQFDHPAKHFLGDWFKLFEKRDPAHFFLWCRFELDSILSK